MAGIGAHGTPATTMPATSPGQGGARDTAREAGKPAADKTRQPGNGPKHAETPPRQRG